MCRAKIKANQKLLGAMAVITLTDYSESKRDLLERLFNKVKDVKIQSTDSLDVIFKFLDKELNESEDGSGEGYIVSSNEGGVFPQDLGYSGGGVGTRGPESW